MLAELMERMLALEATVEHLSAAYLRLCRIMNLDVVVLRVGN